MTYELRRAVLGSKVSIPLSRDEYDSLVRARTNLRALLFIEEQFDLVLNNHMELETDLLSMAVRWMVACSIYLALVGDTWIIAAHHINTIKLADGDILQITSIDFKRYTSDEYDAFLGYRAMEALRNYTQHAGFPLQSPMSPHGKEKVMLEE